MLDRGEAFHGVEKLRLRGPIRLPDAWCTAGMLRTLPPREEPRRIGRGRVLVLDHDAAALHLGTHLGLPVLGVVDGDGDGIVPDCPGAPGSLVLRAVGERDDDLGRELAETSDGSPVRWETFVTGALRALHGRVGVME